VDSADANQEDGDLKGAVLKAAVVITKSIQSPYFSVALECAEPMKGNIPKVCAKGKQDVAGRIKAIALEHNIPIVEDGPMARFLYDMLELGATIPSLLHRPIGLIFVRILVDAEEEES